MQNIFNIWCKIKEKKHKKVELNLFVEIWMSATGIIIIQ